jgi:hypothetical protein
MATGYALATAQVKVGLNPAIGAYTTKSAILTGASGHIYLIKHMRIKGIMDSSGGGNQNGNIGFDLSDNAGANYSYIAPDYAWAAVAVAANQHFMFVYSSEQPVVAFTAWDATVAKVFTGTANIGKNLTLQSGQILRFNPTAPGGAGSFNAAAFNLNLEIEVGYLDYTI